MADLGKNSDDSDYREHEIRGGHIHEEDEEYFEGEEEDYGQDEPDREGQEPESDDETNPMLRMKEMIMAMQVALKQKDIALLESKQQNIELLTELEKISEQYINDQSKEADQLGKVKQYEAEFLEIQQGR